MTPQAFIEQKSTQLVFFVESLLESAIPFSEVKLFTWDILEEWNRIQITCSEQSKTEQVFWHLFYLVQSETEQRFLHDKVFIMQVKECCRFLNEQLGDGPMFCVGIRP
ncbi:hypothetical protein [Psychrobium sp. 1_MG-2023]|uniref:hypothetical protein n=1 Tax=Psychrobium sp. 1_MG-2023 TaxID=3062624 RepID=UPI000C326297|nr:hypothetical protein [Psychrobium sp. 1_MG-2023]MDP2560032.1 hypothetical protein [Psychrobium sp. 1_MG-2023]PKF56306.1 hypothetical protein CW748_10100 [Alteromonadales bacterium alter-6D02]